MKQSNYLFTAALEAKRREEAMPNEPEMLDGAFPVIRFRKQFRGSYKIYSYAAIGTNHTGFDGELAWSTTGPASPKAYTWVDLMEWLGERHWHTVEVLYGLVEEKSDPIIQVNFNSNEFTALFDRY